MTTDAVFAGSIPETYERLMVPLFAIAARFGAGPVDGRIVAHVVAARRDG